MQVPTATRRIFISYRRSDTQGYAGWLNQVLEERFGRSNVFRDLDSISPGEHFPTKVARTIAACTDIFVMIGPGWLGTGPGGSRLADPDDWVRLELEAAIRRGLRLVPLLIGDARMPRREALPPSLHPLCDRQAFELRDSHFAEDVRQVVSQTEHVAVGDFEYVGSASQRRDDRFAELSRLWDERVVKPQAHNLRPQFEALIDVLEPDEAVAATALGILSEGTERDTFLRAALRSLGAAGIIALTPRRLVYVPRRLQSMSPMVVRYRDVIDAKAPTFWEAPVLVLARSNITVNVYAPFDGNKTIHSYIKDRLGQ
jgi:TIR domain